MILLLVELTLNAFCKEGTFTKLTYFATKLLQLHITVALIFLSALDKDAILVYSPHFNSVKLVFHGPRFAIKFAP